MKEAIQLGKIAKMFRGMTADQALQCGYLVRTVSVKEADKLVQRTVVEYEGRLYPLKG